MRAIMTDPGANPRLTLREVASPEPTLSQALVRVEAFSLNPGETRRALDATTGYVPGWDFAGVVERHRGGRKLSSGRGPVCSASFRRARGPSMSLRAAASLPRFQMG